MSCTDITPVKLTVTRRQRKLINWTIGVAFAALVGIWIAVLALSRAPILREQLVRTLGDQLDADVELGQFEVRTFPVLRIHGDQLRLRLKTQKNSAPFIEVRHFEVAGGLFGMLQRHRRFNDVTLDGLRITIPPRTPHDKESGNNAAATIAGAILIDHLDARDAQLVIEPRNPRKAPKVYAIHTLELDSVGFNREIPFTATLTNAIPKGEIAAKGAFGPWAKGDPGSTPLRGRYSFDRADLDPLHGVGGTLNSTGDFTGMLSEIEVRGKSFTPDFSLDVGGSPTPLATEFHLVVDGTSGDTYLKHVAAKLAETPISASGEIVTQPDVKGRTVKLDVAIENGRIQDLLCLAVSAPKPVMLGRLAMHAALLLPPGHARVADRLALTGRFALGGARFTDAGVQAQLATLSRHAQGKKPDDPVGPIVSDMEGRFTLRNGMLRFDDLKFDVPGANVDLMGHYGLRTEQVDFAGTLGMDAPVSKAVGGGIKSLLLKPFDPVFRKHGKRTVLPITITGRREQPKFGLDWGKVIK